MSDITTQDAAKERAWRTFMQNIWLDIVVVVGPLLYDVVLNADATTGKTYWITNGLSVGKTVLLVIIAYVMRLKNRPKTETTK